MADNIARPSAKRSAEFCRLHDQGLSYLQIAKKFGVTRNVVAGAIYRRTKPGQVASYEERRCEILKHATTFRKNKRRDELLQLCRPRRAREHRIVTLLSQGWPYKAIGADLRVSRQRIHQIVGDMCPPREKRRAAA